MIKALRWIARIWSFASIIFMIMMAFRGEWSGFSTWTGNQWIMFIFFPVGLAGSFLAAVKREPLGGCAAVFSVIAFYLVHFIDIGAWPKGLEYILLGFPGFLFLAIWLTTHKERTS